MSLESGTKTTRIPVDMKRWNLARKRVADARLAAEEAREALGSSLHTPAEKSFLGSEAGLTNIAQIMAPDSHVLEEYGLASDYTFTPLAEQAGNTVMQICAWEESTPGSTVSGCVNLRSVLNINTQIESRDIIMPLSIYALTRNRFETLHAAVVEQPTLAKTLEAVCDVFQNHTNVHFTTETPTRDRRVPLGVEATTRQALGVHTSVYRARREASALEAPRDLRIERFEVSHHEDVNNRRFLCESLRVSDLREKTTASFVMSNYVPTGPTRTVPRTVAHLLGTGYNLVGGSENNLLAAHRRALPPSGAAFMQSLAAVRSLAHRVTTITNENPLRHAFECFRSDPRFEKIKPERVEVHPGMRLVVLDLPDGRRVATLLSAVMDCQDVLAAASAAPLEARVPAPLTRAAPLAKPASAGLGRPATSGAALQKLFGGGDNKKLLETLVEEVSALDTKVSDLQRVSHKDVEDLLSLELKKFAETEKRMKENKQTLEQCNISLSNIDVVTTNNSKRTNDIDVNVRDAKAKLAHLTAVADQLTGKVDGVRHRQAKESQEINTVAVREANLQHEMSRLKQLENEIEEKENSERRAGKKMLAILDHDQKVHEEQALVVYEHGKNEHGKKKSKRVEILNKEEAAAKTAGVGGLFGPSDREKIIEAVDFLTSETKRELHDMQKQANANAMTEIHMLSENNRVAKKNTQMLKNLEEEMKRKVGTRSSAASLPQSPGSAFTAFKRPLMAVPGRPGQRTGAFVGVLSQVASRAAH